ncbi:hypothetical protein Tco_0972310 [Tanacetum coccineum]
MLLRPQQVVIGDPKDIIGTKSPNTIVDQTLNDPQKALKNKGIVDSGCSRHMTGNKAYLVEYQDYNGGPVTFGGSKGQITVSQIVNNVSQIKDTVSGQTILILESSIRSDLLFNDDNGIDCLTVTDIYENLPLMGYKGDLTTLTFQKSIFSPQWKYLIHTIIHCLSSKSTSWDQFLTNVASAVICLATDRTFNFSKMIFDGMNRNLEAKKKFLMYPRFIQVFLNNQLQNIPAPLDNLPIPILSKKVFTNITKRGLHFSRHVTPLFPTMLVPATVKEGEGSGTHTEPQTTPYPTQPSVGDQTYFTESSSRPENTQNSRNTLEGTGGSKRDQVQLPHDSPLSGGHTSDRAEGGLNLEELFVLCTNLSNRVLALETSKDAQTVEILKLKTSIKKLKKKCKPSISHHRAWLRSVSILSMKKKLGKNESVSKQGRKNVKPGPTLDDSAFDNLDVDLAYEVLEKGGSNEEPVNVVGNIGVSTIVPEVSTINISTDSKPEVSTATPMTPPTTTSVFDNEDITLAETLVKMKDDKAKLKGVVIKEVEESDRPARSVLTLKPLPKIDPKDKGKCVLEEEPEPAKKLKKSDLDAAQLAMDEEVARQVNAKLQAELERERVAAEEATQAVLASEDKFLHDTIAAQRKFLTEQRAVAIRSKPLTKTQLRNQMITFLKYVGRYTHSRLRNKKFKEVQVLYEKAKKSIQDFVPIGSPEHERLIEKMNKKAAGEILQRRRRFLKNLIVLKWKLSKKKLRRVPGRDQTWSRGHYYKIFISDRSSRWIKTFSEMVTRTMFDAHAEDELWQNQERWNLKSWNFYENCGVHTLILEDGIEIYMLAKRKYPLTKETLEKMMSLKLVAESASDGAYNLLRSIQKQIDKSGSYDGSKKDL